jgi:mono/diheme cytochrome c family protein
MEPTAHSNSIRSITSLLLAFTVLALCGAALAQSPTYKVGRTPTAAELHEWDQVIGPDGKGLPAGKGSAVEGAKIYADNCAVCHGKNGEGVSPFRALVGGRGSLTTNTPVATLGSYWPYATTVWEFINRAMPRGNERSLTPDQVYAVTAFLLFKNDIIKETDILDQKSLVEVQMPNRNGFYPNPPQSEPDTERSWLPFWNQAPAGKEAKSAAKNGKGAN